MRIVVLAGGTSTERDVSLSSGTGICKALRSLGHEACLVDVYLGINGTIDPDHYFPTQSKVDLNATAVLENAPDLDTLLQTDRPENDGFFGPNVLKLCKAADIVFMALHGENGENGKIQAVFDLLEIRYTGTGSLGSALAMHKGVAKDIFLHAGVPSPNGISIHKNKNKKNLEDLGLSFPVIVKPCCGGSSVGVSKATTTEEYEAALEFGFGYEDELVIEECINGREFSVGLIEGKALPVIEIEPVDGMYDYKNKYQAGGAVETCPANLSETLTIKMQGFAERAYKALKLNAYARIDFLLDANNKMYCLEANTLPGMTPTSLLPQEAAQIGYDYPALCQKLIDVSLKKYE